MRFGLVEKDILDVFRYVGLVDCHDVAVVDEVVVVEAL